MSQMRKLSLEDPEGGRGRGGKEEAEQNLSPSLPGPKAPSPPLWDPAPGGPCPHPELLNPPSHGLSFPQTRLLTFSVLGR